MVNIITFYRLANWLYRHKIPLLPQLIKLFMFFIYNSSVPYQANIGKGTFCAYGGIGVVIHKKASIGANVVIGTNVTIGGRSGLQDLPVIGNKVYIATGAKILGDVKIGDYAVIGANAVVIKNVPEKAIVGGVPAKIISYNGGEEYYSKL